MFGHLGTDRSKKTAYTLAEMLVVMAIIALILLALPPATKKLFKVDETRKAHGRFECYYDLNGELHSHRVLENGTDENKNLGKAESCTFTPPNNAIYLIVYMVGGGGAGAEIENGAAYYEGTGDSLRKLVDPSQFYAVSYLYRTDSGERGDNPNHPAWINYLEGRYADYQLPWKDTVDSSEQGSRFDVARSYTYQQLRYRLGGSAGRTVVSFMPAAPAGVTMVLTPGKGGEVQTEDQKYTETDADGNEIIKYHRSGGDGEDTTITYRYSGGDEEVALRAYGGSGGSGKVDTYTGKVLLGNAPSDDGLTKYSSVAMKDTNFGVILEESDNSGKFVTAMPYETINGKKSFYAGRGGNGEAQFVKDTAGYIFYEYDQCKYKDGARYNEEWMDLLQWPIKILNWNVYTAAGSDVDEPIGECKEQELKDIEVERYGFCSWGVDSILHCVIGYSSSSAPSSDDAPYFCRAASGDKYYCTEYNSTTNYCTVYGTGDEVRVSSCDDNSGVSVDYTKCAAYGYDSEGRPCMQMDIELTQDTDGHWTVIKSMSPNPKSTSSDAVTLNYTEYKNYTGYTDPDSDSGIETKIRGKYTDCTRTYDPSAYSYTYKCTDNYPAWVLSNDETQKGYESPFYDCTYSSNSMTITCKTKIDRLTHSCDKPDYEANKYLCANGDTPDCSTGDKYCTCKARDGGDGAVVIIW